MDKHSKIFHAALKSYQQGNLNEAAGMLTTQLKKKPKNPDSLHLLGVILSAQGQLQKANTLYRKALKFTPNAVALLNSLADNLLKQQRYDEAKILYLRCVKLEPHKWQLKLQLGVICRFLNENTEAESFFEQTLDLNPLSTDALINLIQIRLNTGKLSKIQGMAEAIESMALRFINNGQATELTMLIRMAPMLPMLPDTYQRMLSSMDQIYTRPPMQRPQRTRHTNGKVRIGYIAGEFGDHPISHVMWDVFKQHNHDAFEIIVYSLVNRNSSVDQIYVNHVKAHCDEYIDLSGHTLKQSTERIAHDEIDILVNLSGYMTTRCAEIGSFRPAAVNVYWLGQGGNMGLSSVDYVIANDIVMPESEWSSADEKGYTESVASLPESYHCAPTPIIPGCTWRREEFGLNEDSFVFCAFNNPAKINSEVFDAWMNILKRVSNSQLWLSNPYGTDDLPTNLAIEAKARGIDPDRLIFATRIPEKLQHLPRHQLADLFLDAFSYNASTTAIDALWAGLPVLTRPGADFFSRIGASHVINAGLADMVCETTREFEDRAVELADNPELLGEIRERLITTREHQPLFDVSRFVRHLEAAYQRMWERQQSGQKPVSFQIKAAIKP
ncbi:tetratricopeptide repeat protein [Pseudomonadota bacterium]